MLINIETVKKLIMTINEKFKEWNNVFWEYFVSIPDKEKGETALETKGTLLPFASFYWNSKKGNTGDATINYSKMLIYMWLCRKNKDSEVTIPITIEDALNVMLRLENSAYDFYKNAFPYLFDNNYDPEDKIFKKGFFVRDDIDEDKVIWGNWRMLHTLDNEDPCHSPFVSQDQVWNINPALSAIMLDEENCSENERYTASFIGNSINDYIADNGYTIYNPYLSYIKHMTCYLPDFDLTVTERQSDRYSKFKPNIKVKRGANNWYYAGGTQSCCDAFSERKYDYNHTLRTFLYRGTIFFLDRIYEPIFKLFTGNDFKHNSYYCYAATSGIWYNKNYKKRFLKRFNKSLVKAVGNPEELFEGFIAPIVLNDSKNEVDSEGLERYLDNYPSFQVDTTNAENIISNPIEALILWQFWKSIKEMNALN